MSLQPGSLTGTFSALHHSDPAVVSVSSGRVSSSRSGALPRSPVLRLEPCSRRPAWGRERSFASTLQPHTVDVIEDRRAVACQMLNDEERAWLCEQPGEPSLSFDQRQDGRFAA